MYQKIAVLSSGYIPTTLHEVLRLLLLVASFAMLLGFGFTLLSPAGTSKRYIWLPALGMVGFWLTAVVIIGVVLEPGEALLVAQADALARYSLGIPAALLGAWALMTQQRTFREANMPQFGRDLIWATTALLLFGVIGQVFVRETTLVPSNVINSALFLQWFGIPVQLFRALAAIMMLVFMIRALKAFDVESRRRLDAANQARLNALNQVVDAQEAERKRIARELHDATGQSLTAIALGLRGVEMHIENCDSPPLGLLDKVRDIKGYSTSALGELHQIIADLRPQILDDMGLAAALKWYVQSYQQRRSLPTELIVEGAPVRLPAEYETVLFRITQEALTNIAKHARATRVVVTLSFSPNLVDLTVQDNGRGFASDQALQRNGRNTGWGLLGMRERASLIGGQAVVESSPGQGACIRVTVPTSRELLRVKDSPVTSR